MNVWRSIEGSLTAQLTSAEPENALAAINASGIPIFSLQWISDLTCRFQIRRRDQKRLEALIEKRGESLHVQVQPGLYWTAKRLRRRPVLLSGFLVLFLSVFYLPSRILFIQVEGNSRIPARKILEAAEDCGICFGASRREVRSEKVKNDLLGAVAQLQWAGVNTSGCTATISVRERNDTEHAKDKNYVSNIIATQDGYVLSGTATKGTALFQEGQTVKKGEVLISGYTDCGLSIRAGRAEGEVFAQTNRDFYAVTPVQFTKIGRTQGIKQKVSLIFRKKRINLWKDSGILEGSCGRMYEEYYATLPGGFQLPIALCIETYTYYEPENYQVMKEDAQEHLMQFTRDYLTEQMVAGQIRSGKESITQRKGIVSLEGNYTCIEMIGREQREQIGEQYGKIG